VVRGAAAFSMQHQQRARDDDSRGIRDLAGTPIGPAGHPIGGPGSSSRPLTFAFGILPLCLSLSPSLSLSLSLSPSFSDYNANRVYLSVWRDVLQLGQNLIEGLEVCIATQANSN
jgi:hypothetical protein